MNCLVWPVWVYYDSPILAQSDAFADDSVTDFVVEWFDNRLYAFVVRGFACELSCSFWTFRDTIYNKIEFSFVVGYTGGTSFV